jgi:ABC-2 type transport system permease protein
MVKLSRIAADLVIFGRGYFKDKAGLFFTLILPVILILLFGAIFSGGLGAAFFGESSGSTTVYVQNFDQGPVSGTFINALNGTHNLQLSMVPTTENFGSYMISHTVSDGIIIPATFSSSYQAGTGVNVTVFGNPSQSSSVMVRTTVQEVINGLNLQRNGGTAVLGIDQTTVKTRGFKYIDFLVPGLIGYAVLGPMFSMVNISSEYKKVKLFRQLSLTPLSKTDWLISKMIWFTLLTAISFVMMVAAGYYLFGANIALSIWILPFLILGPMFFTAFGMLVGSVAKSVETAAVIGNAIVFPMMFLSGSFFPLFAMPGYLQTIAHALPLFYFIDGLTQVMIYSSYAQAAVDIIVVAAMAIVTLAAAVNLFKWRED